MSAGTPDEGHGVGRNDPELPSDEEWALFEAELNADTSIRPLGPRDWLEPPEPEEPFVPPDAPPVFGGDPLLTLAWVGAVGGPLVMIAILVFWQHAARLAITVCAVVFLASLAVLLWRMPAERSRRDDDDSGAVV